MTEAACDVTVRIAGCQSIASYCSSHLAEEISACAKFCISRIHGKFAFFAVKPE